VVLPKECVCITISRRRQMSHHIVHFASMVHVDCELVIAQTIDPV
jgi:hypothetical protein